MIAKEADARLRARRAHRHGQDQARPDHRRRRRRLAPRQGRRARSARSSSASTHPTATSASSATPAASSAKEKRELPARLAPFESGERGSGEPSRWSSDKDLAWIGLRPELVVEITFDHISDNRIRHGAKVQRWRDDKPPVGVHDRPARRLAPRSTVRLGSSRAHMLPLTSRARGSRRRRASDRACTSVAGKRATRQPVASAARSRARSVTKARRERWNCQPSTSTIRRWRGQRKSTSRPLS